MDELVFYVGQGDPNDKLSQESVALVALAHSSHQYAAFRAADCPQNGAVLTGVGAGERLFVAVPEKALINVYSWGKEGVDQRMPVPEPLTCLALVHHPRPAQNNSTEAPKHNLPAYRVPWLLAGGSKSGKIYVWELSSGNLLCVKEAHYQQVSVLQFSACGTYLVSGGHDARCMVWRTLDLALVYDNAAETAVKPYAAFSDHTLPVTDVLVSEAGLSNDLKVYTVSRDNTLRVYDIATRKQLSTFVLPYGIECITKDPANRALYVGLSNGFIRTVPLYQINPNSGALEAVGGSDKVVTLDQDPSLLQTFLHHQDGVSADTHVTRIAIAMDGATIVSGDSAGRIYISDIVTRQVVKTYTPCNSAISAIFTYSAPIDVGNAQKTVNGANKDKKHRLLPNLKRVLTDTSAADHSINVEIAKDSDTDLYSSDFDAWLQKKAQEELEFKNLSDVNSQVIINGAIVDGNDSARVTELEEKLARLSQAYTDLRANHEVLLEEHKLLLES